MSGNQEAIVRYSNSLTIGMENLLKHAVYLSYFMRGGIQYEDVLDRTYQERKVIYDFIQERINSEMEKTKKTKLKLPPVY